MVYTRRSNEPQGKESGTMKDNRTNEQLISAVKSKMTAEVLAAASNFKVENCKEFSNGRLVSFTAVTWDTTRSNRHGFINVKLI
jgi:hypothetical protein